MENNDEEKLKESEEKFREIFDNSPICITITELETGKFADVNITFLQFTGLNKEQVVGKFASNINIWKNPVDRDSVISSLKKNIKISNMEFELRSPTTGKEMTGLFSAQIVKIANKPYIVSTVVDITDKKKAEEALKLKFDELEKLNKFMMDRENKMVELKKKINELEKQLANKK
jgi:PAS domain S-box-containing protein